MNEPFIHLKFIVETIAKFLPVISRENVFFATLFKEVRSERLLLFATTTSLFESQYIIHLSILLLSCIWVCVVSCIKIFHPARVVISRLVSFNCSLLIPEKYKATFLPFTCHHLG